MYTVNYKLFSTHRLNTEKTVGGKHKIFTQVLYKTKASPINRKGSVN
jgi:hypothetical protein